MTAVNQQATTKSDPPPAIPTVVAPKEKSVSKPVVKKKASKAAAPSAQVSAVSAKAAIKPASEPGSENKSEPAADAVAAIGIGMLGVRPSTPSSVVYVDDKRVGKTPLMPIELSAGKHTVRLHCATGGINASKSISVNIEAGKTLKLGKYDFNKQEWK